MKKACTLFGRLAASLALSSLALAGVASAAPLTHAQVARIDALVAHAMATQHIAGAEVGVGVDGHLLFDRGYGLRDRAHGLPVTARTIFPVGSISKSFLATAVMMFVQSGRISLDAPVARYLPDVPHAREITVRELLDQTSGLPDYLENRALFHSILTSTVVPRSIASYVAMVARKPLDFPPGSKWEYSNTNYAILGLLVEKIAGKPYQSVLQERIFAPLGLASTQVMQHTPPVGSDVADGYSYAGGRYVPIAPQSMSWGNAAGSMASDARDLITFDEALFSGRLVSQASLHTMMTPPPDRPVLPAGDPLHWLARGYGFAWMLGAADGRRIEWHNGGIIGGKAMNAVWPGSGLEVIVLTNVSSANVEQLSVDIARACYAR